MCLHCARAASAIKGDNFQYKVPGRLILAVNMCLGGAGNDSGLVDKWGPYVHKRNGNVEWNLL